MILSPYAYNSNTTINDGSNFRARLELSVPYGQGEAQVLEVPRHAAPPTAVDKLFLSRQFKLYVAPLGTYHSQIATLKALFNTRDRTLRALVVQDTADGNRQWSIQCYCLKHEDNENGLTEQAFVMYTPDALWSEVSQQSDSWNITATGQTHAVTPHGTLNCAPIIEITPTTIKGANTGFGYKRRVDIYNPTTRAMPTYPVDITAGGLDTATPVGAGKMLASGNDVRVFVDGTETNRWLQGMNGAATQIWITQDWSAKIELTILAAGATGDITFQNTQANVTAIKALPTVGAAKIDSEIVTWTGKNNLGLTLTGTIRGARGSTAATHSAGATMRRIEHDVLLMYGNSGMTAPETDDTAKPIIDLTSTNTSWVYGTNFATLARKRAGEWVPSLLSSLAGAAARLSRLYLGLAYTDADPATAMGMRIASWLQGTLAKAENAALEWRLYHPAGATAVTAVGQGRRSSASWPGGATSQFADFQYSNDGKTWASKWVEAAPTNDNAFHAWASHSAVTLGATYRYLRFLFSGAVGAGAGNVADNECTSITVALDSTTVPQVTLSAEIANYELNCTITNQTSGEYIQVRFLMVLNQTLQIDCLNRKVVYLADNSLHAEAIVGWSSVRQPWLDLAGGSASTLKFDDVGTAAITFVTKTSGRAN